MLEIALQEKAKKCHVESKKKFQIPSFHEFSRFQMHFMISLLLSWSPDHVFTLNLEDLMR